MCIGQLHDPVQTSCGHRLRAESFHAKLASRQPRAPLQQGMLWKPTTARDPELLDRILCPFRGPMWFRARSRLGRTPPMPLSFPLSFPAHRAVQPILRL